MIREAKDIDDLVAKVIDNGEIDRLRDEWETAKVTLRKRDVLCKTHEEELMRKKQDIVDKYTRIADERTKEASVGPDFDRRNGNTIKMLSYMHAVNNLKWGDFDRYIHESIQSRTIDNKMHDTYKPFDFQMILIKNGSDLLRKEKTATISLYPPNGMEHIIESDTFQISSSDIESFGVKHSEGYLIVLPLAPFKWEVAIQINGKDVLDNKKIVLAYVTNGTNTLKNYHRKEYSFYGYQDKYDWNMYFLLYCLKNMVRLRDHFNLRYAIPVSQDNLYRYNYRHYNNSFDYKSSYVYCQYYRPYGCGLFKYTSRFTGDYCLQCNEIRSIGDIVPFNEIRVDEIKTTWTYLDYIRVGSGLGPLSCIDRKAERDVNEFNKLYNQYSREQNDLNSALNDERNKKEKYLQKQDELKSIQQYFFPKVDERYSNYLIGNSLIDVIVVVYDGTNASIGLPNNKVYLLPDSYEGEDGNQIILSYLSTSNEVDLVIKSNDCDVSKGSDHFVFSMKDNEVGSKKLKCKASVIRRSDNEELVCEEFYLCYERREMPDHLVTSVSCSLDSNRWYPNYLFPTSFPCSVDVYRNGRKESTVQCKQRSNALILSSPKIYSNAGIKYGDKGYGTRFTWNDKGVLSVFSKPIPHGNSVSMPSVHCTDPKVSLANLKSGVMSRFLDAFSDLSLVIISANRERNDIISILNSCLNGNLLPTIKEAAKTVLDTISHQDSLLRWNSVINVVKRKEVESEVKYEGEEKIDEEIHEVIQNEEEDDGDMTVVKGHISSDLAEKIRKRVLAIVVEDDISKNP